MKHTRALQLSFAALALLALGSCHRSADSVRVGGTLMPAAPAQGTAVVFGTVFDLMTGEPAAGVEVQFQDGKSVKSDSLGRFEIAGLPTGTQGEVTARAPDGREGRLALSVLGNERREVVLHLAAR